MYSHVIKEYTTVSKYLIKGVPGLESPWLTLGWAQAGVTTCQSLVNAFTMNMAFSNSPKKSCPSVTLCPIITRWERV